MTTGLLFWVLMILSFIFGLWAGAPPPGQPWNWKIFGNNLLLFVLLALLGWKTFGPALHN